MSARSPIEALLDRADFRCTICEARAADGPCGCWERCRCGQWAMTALGEERANSLHSSRGCSNPKCSNRKIERGCPSVWWYRRDEGKLCVLPIGHAGRHRYTVKPPK